MTAGIRWLSAQLAEVPPGDGWLGPRERAVLQGLRIDKRRADWRLGRWALKQAAGFDVEVLAADDGAPEAWRGTRRLPGSISVSHRDGRAIAVVADGDLSVGCDLERVEPRSEAFVGDFLAPAEQERVLALDGEERALAANLAWTAKEAAAKVRREGLRLDVRNAVTVLEPAGGEWRPLRVEWPDGVVTFGWWRSEPGWVMTVAGDAAGPPEPAQKSGWR